MELIRKLVFALEDSPSGFAPTPLEIEGYTDEQVGYHAYLIIDAGLAVGSERTHLGSSSPEALLTSLTWAGHEFAEAARDETRWKKAMDIVQEKGGSITLSVLIQLLTNLMKSTLGLP
jgi:hypothetical protein